MTEEFRRACMAVDRNGGGSIRKRNGEVVSGRLLTYASEHDDPDGDGYIWLVCEDGGSRLVYASEFAELLEPKGAEL